MYNRNELKRRNSTSREGRWVGPLAALAGGILGTMPDILAENPMAKLVVGAGAGLISYAGARFYTKTAGTFRVKTIEELAQIASDYILEEDEGNIRINFQTEGWKRMPYERAMLFFLYEQREECHGLVECGFKLYSEGQVTRDLVANLSVGEFYVDQAAEDEAEICSKSWFNHTAQTASNPFAKLQEELEKNVARSMRRIRWEFDKKIQYVNKFAIQPSPSH